MKKLALISGLLFFIVLLGVNTLTSDKKSFDVVYPAIPVSTLTTIESPGTATSDSTAPSQADPSPIKYNYLIVGSFSDLEQANRVAGEFSGKYKAEMLVLPPASNGYYRISYGRYTTTAEALAALEMVKQVSFPDAWLLTSK